MKKLAWIALLCVSTGWAKAPTALFYMIETPKSMRSFTEHVDKIGLLVPTWYGVDAQGLVQGEPNPFVVQLAAQSLFNRFAGFELAAREFPVIGVDLARWQ